MDTAIILAGGKSSRMGFDKQFLMLRDKYIIETITDKLKRVFKEIIIVTNTPHDYKKYGFKLVEDEIKDFGPLAGIHVGLKSSGSMYNYIIACDMPFINLKYLEYMMELIRQHEGKVDGVVTKLGEWIEPFNAFYSKSLLETIEANIKKGKKQIGTMLEESHTLYISEATARRFSPGWEMFTNVNTLKDYEGIMNQLMNQPEV